MFGPRRLPKPGFAVLIIASVATALLLLNWTAAYLWFDNLGFARAFLTMRLLKAGIFLSALIVVFSYLWLNIRTLCKHLSWNSAFGTAAPWLSTAIGPNRVAKTLLVGAGLALALIVAGLLAAHWDTVLRYYWHQDFGEVDPIYGRDTGFYLFSFPLLELVQNTVLTVSTIVIALLVWLYSVTDELGFGPRLTLTASHGVFLHLGLNLSLFFAASAWGFYLDRFALLLSTDGVIYGAGYTDVYVVRPLLWSMIVLTSALGVGALVAPLVARGPWLLMGALSYPLLWVIAVGLVPLFVQSFIVEPNELELEEPFIRHNISHTRRAFGLGQVDERSYQALSAPTLADISRNRQTTDNIRLWDWRPLSQTFRQLQRIRTYYEMGDVDVDRYRLNGEYKQVMLAARELAEELPSSANTWVNRTLQYTHGYGLAMSFTATKTEQGSPVLVVKNLPPESQAGPSLTEPAIYFGEQRSDYRLVNTAVEEFDYPRGDDNAYSRYRGVGGIPLDSFWKKLLFAWDQADINLLITSYLTPQSRIQYLRSVEERVTELAPFLELDPDPYPVISDGRIYWIQDAYTVAESYPYADPYQNKFNYIRNSVKVVVDAYDGTTTFYVIDPDDPVTRVYRDAFPRLFRDFADMPRDLQQHIRYPQALFTIQVEKYNTYHMTIPQVFYNGEDLWTVPREKYGGEVIRMDPYYVLMQLPEEKRLQFLLMTPLTPKNRDNMIAWMAARCDLPGYGELLVFKLSKERLILGPMQVEALIDQDTLVSQQLSLWDQRGSRVIRGNLLVIPIERSFVYVEPVYLIAEDSDIPQLKRIIVSDGEEVAMAPQLEEALAVVFGGLRAPGRYTEEQTESESERMSSAREALSAAEAALREGDWGKFGRAMQQLKDWLER